VEVLSQKVHRLLLLIGGIDKQRVSMNPIATWLSKTLLPRFLLSKNYILGLKDYRPLPVRLLKCFSRLEGHLNTAQPLLMELIGNTKMSRY
jgi:hypothetical protein